MHRDVVGVDAPEDRPDRVAVDLRADARPLVEHLDFRAGGGEEVDHVGGLEVVLLGDHGDPAPFTSTVPASTSQPCTTWSESTPGVVGAPRHRPGGARDHVGVEGQHRLHGGVHTEAHVDVEELHLVLLVVDEVLEGITAGRVRRYPQLAAEGSAALQHGELVAPSGRHAGHLEPGRASADHHDPLRFRRGTQVAPLELAAHDGVHRAHRPAEHLGGMRLDGVRDATVAGDAAADLDHAALAGLVGELGIGDARPRHSHQVTDPLGEQLLGHHRVVDPAGEQSGDRVHIRSDGPTDASRYWAWS